MNVLIIDDEKLITEDLTRDVRTLYPDANIFSTTSAEEALNSLGNTEYEVALLDIDMPEMDGLSLARKLAAANPAVNIIFITGYSQYALEAHTLYCSAFLVKPVSIRMLRKAFENLRHPFIDLPQDFSSDHYSGGAVIGKRIEMHREQRGLSRQELADLMEVTRQTVFRWEQGERVPDVLTYVRLAKILRVPIDEFLTANP